MLHHKTFEITSPYSDRSAGATSRTIFRWKFSVKSTCTKTSIDFRFMSFVAFEEWFTNCLPTANKLLIIGIKVKPLHAYSCGSIQSSNIPATLVFQYEYSNVLLSNNDEAEIQALQTYSRLYNHLVKIISKVDLKWLSSLDVSQ